MNKFKTVLFVASILLVLAFTFSCSSNGDNDGGGICNGGSGINGGSGKGNSIANYKTKRIGDQVWMAENLNYNVSGSKCGGNDGKLYEENTINCDKFGRLYNWATAMDIDTRYNSEEWGKSDVKHQGICPSGWHLPSNAEWQQLMDFFGGYKIAGTKLKATSGWNDGYEGKSGNGTDELGFKALPGGYFSRYGFSSVGYHGNWWCSTESFASGTYVLHMSYNDGEVMRNTMLKAENLHSVRCIQDLNFQQGDTP